MPSSAFAHTCTASIGPLRWRVKATLLTTRPSCEAWSMPTILFRTPRLAIALGAALLFFTAFAGVALVLAGALGAAASSAPAASGPPAQVPGLRLINPPGEPLRRFDDDAETLDQ